MMSWPKPVQKPLPVIVGIHGGGCLASKQRRIDHDQQSARSSRARELRHEFAHAQTIERQGHLGLEPVDGRAPRVLDPDNDIMSSRTRDAHMIDRDARDSGTRGRRAQDQQRRAEQDDPGHHERQAGRARHAPHPFKPAS